MKLSQIKQLLDDKLHLTFSTADDVFKYLNLPTSAQLFWQLKQCQNDVDKIGQSFNYIVQIYVTLKNKVKINLYFKQNNDKKRLVKIKTFNQILSNVIYYGQLDSEIKF